MNSKRFFCLIRQLCLLPLTLCLLVSCSITSHLPEGEVLYTGVSHINHHLVDTLDDAVREIIANNLEVAPNSAFLGSAYHMAPLPIGLWFYNGLYPKKDKGFRHWLWIHFKSDPTLLSAVNPRLRAQACEAALKDEGYFDASVTWDTVYFQRDSLKARLSYDVKYEHHSHFGHISYIRSREPRIDSILHHTLDKTLLHEGDRFSASKLVAEQERITATLRDSGYFFFKPDFIRFAADSTRQPNVVDLRVLIGIGADTKALSPCTIDSVHYKLDYGFGLKSQHADTLRFLTVGYSGKQLVKTRYLRRALGFRRRARYSPDRIALCKTLISRLNVFKYTTTEFQMLYEANDSSGIVADTTRMRLLIHATYAQPWQGTTEVGCVYKDNEQMGPGVTLMAMRRNLFGGGEKLSFQLDGAYEWNTRQHSTTGNGLVNSFELGGRVSLAVPRLQIPRFFRPERENPVYSSYSISYDWMRRSGLFEMLKASSSVEYGFSINKSNTFAVTPLKLTYTSTVRKTADFTSLMSRYPGLKHSFEDMFIPQVQLSWTFDNNLTTTNRASTQYLNVTLAEAGGLCDVFTGKFGSHRTQGERQLFFERFSQFLKATAEFRSLYRISDKLTLASRLQGGVGYAYGNSSAMPYSEQFFIGGPNSLRGFSVRGVGPGNYFVEGMESSPYDYLNRVGNIKFEGNMELRFPLVGSLNGALFVDAGNVWLIEDELSLETEKTHGSKMLNRNFAEQLALDAGLGFRLDMGMLVLRLDVGVPLHDPMSGGSYFNCRNNFLGNLGWNLAVGYPF